MLREIIKAFSLAGIIIALSQQPALSQKNLEQRVKQQAIPASSEAIFKTLRDEMLSFDEGTCRSHRVYCAGEKFYTDIRKLAAAFGIEIDGDPETMHIFELDGTLISQFYGKAERKIVFYPNLAIERTEIRVDESPDWQEFNEYAPVKPGSPPHILRSYNAASVNVFPYMPRMNGYDFWKIHDTIKHLKKMLNRFYIPGVSESNYESGHLTAQLRWITVRLLQKYGLETSLVLPEVVEASDYREAFAGNGVITVIQGDKDKKTILDIVERPPIVGAYIRIIDNKTGESTKPQLIKPVIR